MALRRRDFLAGLAAFPLVGNSACADVGNVADCASLGDIAASRSMFFGSAFDIGVIEDPNFRALYAHQARILTTNLSMKFWSLRPEEDRTQFARADRLVDFALANQIALRGHNLIWNEWNPPWVKKLSSARREYWLDRHVDEVVTRYAGRVHSWDVVNEPFWPGHHKAGGFRDGPWFEAMGKDYIRRAFLRAGRADPSAKLALNESGPEWTDPGTEIIRAGLLRQIDEIRDAGGRVDIIGLECHWMAQNHFDASRFSDYLARLREKNVEIYITEIDIDDDRMPDDIAERDELVAKRYSELLLVALREPAVKAVITWDLIDPLSWYPSVYPRPSGSQRQPRPLLFDAKLQPKASYRAVADALRSRVS